MKILLNRNFELPADGWFHIAPLGEFPGHTGGEKPERVLQVIDAAAVAGLKNRFDEAAKAAHFPGLLVDFDHFSTDTGKPSEAAGWITALENRADGLWAQIRFSDVGEAAVRGGRYRLVSPVWDYERIGNGRVRPTILRSVALTNDPNLKGLVPLSNRQTGDPGTGNPNHQPKGNSMDYKTKLLKLLGLPAEATDEQIDAALTPAAENMAKGKTADELKNRVEALDKQLIERDVETLGITDEAERKTACDVLANAKDRKAALALLKNRTAAPAAKTEKPLHNRSGAAVPGTKLDDEAAKEDPALAAKILNRAREIESTQKINFTRAHALATQELTPQA